MMTHFQETCQLEFKSDKHLKIDYLCKVKLFKKSIYSVQFKIFQRTLQKDIYCYC